MIQSDHAEEKQFREEKIGDGGLAAERNALVEEEQHGGRERESLEKTVEVGESGEERGRSAGRDQQRAEEVGGVEVEVFLLEAAWERGERETV